VRIGGIAANPQRLIAWWTLLGLLVLIGVALIVAGIEGLTGGFPAHISSGPIVTGGLQLAVDRPYIPRAFRASRDRRR
jgi:hypothetical protein